jgi:hypothetical protein
MELQSARVRLVDRVGERIVRGLRSHARGTGEKRRPGREARGIHRVSRNAYVENHRVQSDGLRAIELISQFGAL